MKGLICYYSGSGNTKLVCQYISEKVSEADFDLFNVATDGKPEIEKYDIIGFATFADFLGAPYLMEHFIKQLGGQNKPAFVFNTYGFISGKTLKRLKKLATAQGFRVIAGHSLHTPESYPPLIAKGKGFANSPNEKELERFNQFLSSFNQIIADVKAGTGAKLKIRTGVLNRILPAMSRNKAKKDMGEKFVDESLCKECGICKAVCPCGAIKLDPKPVFDMDKCRGCWACYNHCPEKAIYTKKLRGVGQYPKPNEQLKEKLKIL